MKEEIATELLRACRAMFEAFTRHPSNNEEKRHALILADKAIEGWRKQGKD